VKAYPGILCVVMCIYCILKKSSFSDFLVTFHKLSGTAHQSMACKAPTEELILFPETNMKKKVG